MTRARDRTDVDEALDVIGLQPRHKRLDRQCGVPESEDGAVRPMRFLRWRMFAHDGCSERAGCRINTIGLPASTYPLHSACAASAVEQTDLPPMIKRKKRADNPARHPVMQGLQGKE